MTTPLPTELLALTGKVALVTGAGHGIGAAIARRFAQSGAQLVVHFREDRDGAEATVAAIHAAGGNALAAHAELADEAAVAALMTRAISAFGALDILVNNAGVFPTAPFLELTAADWRDMYRANVDTAFLCTQAAARHMQANGGAIVNIASIAALSPGPEHSHYNSSKAAVVMLTKSAAQELGTHGIRVNAVSPGVIERPGIEDQWPEGVARWRARAPLTRLGQPDDIADACLFLASPAARWITGHNLVVDGGMLAASIF